MKRYESEYLPAYFCGPLMATYSQTVIFGHWIHRVSLGVTRVAVASTQGGVTRFGQWTACGHCDLTL